MINFKLEKSANYFVHLPLWHPVHVCSISHGSWNAQTKVGDLKKLIFQSKVLFWFNVFWPCSVPSYGFYMKEGTLHQKGPQGQNQFWCIVSNTCSNFLEEFINNFFFHLKCWHFISPLFLWTWYMNGPWLQSRTNCSS